MSKQYELTKQIHAILPLIAEKYGKEIVLTGDFVWLKKDGQYKIHHKQYSAVLLMVEKEIKIKSLAIQAPQIRQILLALQDELGKNPEIHKKDVMLKQISETDFSDYRKGIEMGLATHAKNNLPWYYSEVLCHKWLDGLNPLFDSEPITVLTEFLEVLENLNNQ